MHQKKLYCIALFFWVFLTSQNALSQTKDSLIVKSSFSGLLGATTNGLSIIPTFSLNAPALNFLLSVKKNKFSFDPDIRLTFDGKKGGMVFWFRYRPVQGKKFNLQLGAHPAYNFALRDLTEGTKKSSITQARRFVAAEIFPSFRVSNKLGLGLYYLNGFGMQLDGPQDTRFIAVNANISGIRIFKDHTLQYTPQFYFLNIDRESGTYYTHTIGIASPKHPILIQSTVNQEIKTNIKGSRNFSWNLSLFYSFNNQYGKRMGENIYRIEDKIIKF